MGWRIVSIDSLSKISYKAGYLIVKREEDTLIPISEIDLLLLSTPRVNITGVALTELIKKKIKIIFCDENHNPIAETFGLYNHYVSSKRINSQIAWSNDSKQYVFTKIIKQKILNQAKLLRKCAFEYEAYMLEKYSNEVIIGDVSNREGHAAKVYFDSLFAQGNQFNRRENNEINSALNYGYSILLSYINREVVANGYLTQIGLKHCNEYNDFNLSCDLIEPFRIIVDEYVYLHSENVFNGDYKYNIVNLLTKEVNFDNQSMHLSNVISSSIKSIFNALEDSKFERIKLYEF